MPVQKNGREIFNDSDINNPDIDGGTVDGATIATSNITVGAGKTLDVSAGTLTLANDQISGDKVEGGTIAATTITALTTTTAADNTATTIAATTAYAKSQDAVLAREPDQGVAMTYAESGSSGITVADNDNIDFGTGNFTLVWKGSLPDWTPATAADVQLMRKWSANVGWFVAIDATMTTGRIRLRLAATDYYTASSNTLVDGTVHEITNVISQTGLTWQPYIDGVAFGSPITVAASDVSNAVATYVSGTDAIRNASTTHHAYTFNRALTAAEVLDLYRNGIAEADKWGSQTAKYTSDFSAGVDGWVKFGNGAVDGNIDSIGGEDNWLRFTCSAGAGGHAMERTNALVAYNGKKVRVTFKYYIPSTNTKLNNIQLMSGGGALTGTIWTTLDTATTVSYEFTASGSLWVAGLDDGVYSFDDADDVFYIKELTITEIGATLALTPEGIQPAPGQWLDASSNKLHALMPAAGATTTRLIRNGWADYTTGSTDQFLHGGTTRAILPAGNAIIEEIWAYSAGTPTFTLGDSAAAPATLVASITLVAATWTKLPLLKNSTTGDDIYWDVTAGGAATRFQIKYRTISLA